MSCILFARDTRETVCWGSSLGGEKQSLACSELWEMNFGFCLVDDLAAEATVHFIP